MKIDYNREELLFRYAQAQKDNPLLARIRGECQTIGWTEGEIVTLQLLVAVQSNASLQEELQRLQGRLAVIER